MERYLAAKLAMFARMREWRGPDCCAVLNLDDAAIQAAFDRGAFTGMRVVTCGRGEGCDLLLRECTPSDGGMRLRFDALGEPFDLQLPYLGEYNGYNLLGISAAAMALGFPLDAVATKLSQLGQVPGRLQRILHEGIGAYVDYAHSPDSLARALAAVRVGCQGRLIAVFGCGGERDRGKRPLMGRVAVEGADIVIITSDNPRGEPARAILDDILEGIGGAPCVVIEDRRAAIRHAVQLASRDDAILVAGKGHEEYQIIGRETRRFSDVDEVRDAFRLRSEGR
jgi:UDP-N-acetylmuramoyl-L-alanyl-D-glutamate--2,6-diaminopimelate ligase